MADEQKPYFMRKPKGGISAEVENGLSCTRCSKERIILNFVLNCGCSSSKMGFCLPCIENIMTPLTEEIIVIPCDKCARKTHTLLKFNSGCECDESLGLCLLCVKDMVDAYIEVIQSMNFKPAK